MAVKYADLMVFAFIVTMPSHNSDNLANNLVYTQKFAMILWRMDGRMDEWMDEPTNQLMDGWMDKK